MYNDVYLNNLYNFNHIYFATAAYVFSTMKYIYTEVKTEYI